MSIIKVYVPVPGVGAPGTSKEPAQPKPRSTITVLEDILPHPATKIKVNKAHFIKPSFGLSTVLTPRKRTGDHNFTNVTEMGCVKHFDKKRPNNLQRQTLLRVAKNRNPEQVTLKVTKKVRRAEFEEFSLCETKLGALQVVAPIKKPRLEEPVAVGDSLFTSASGIPFSFDVMMELLEHEPEYAHSLLPHISHFV